MDKEVVKELIQKDFTKKNLTKELAMILDDNHRSKIFENYYQLECNLSQHLNDNYLHLMCFN